jgi:hypothetical protein
MREAAIMLHGPSAGTCRMGQAMRAHENISEVQHGGASANMALRRVYRGLIGRCYTAMTLSCSGRLTSVTF